MDAAINCDSNCKYRCNGKLLQCNKGDGQCNDIPLTSFDYGTLSENKLLTKSFKEVGGINFVDNVELIPYILKMVIRLQKQINQQNELIQSLANNSP